MSEVRARSGRSPRESRRPIGYRIYGPPGGDFVPAPGRVEWAVAWLCGRRDIASYALCHRRGRPVANMRAEVFRWWATPVKLSRFGYVTAVLFATVIGDFIVHAITGRAM